ncbi:MAG TPA: transcription elongation factor GreA [Thermomicrobiales bacterium]|nr:transcription elongation factor GreA [Thermomicrobiales bacterium]
MASVKRVPVTRDGLERLKAELEDLRDVKMAQITEAVAEARSHGDLRENAGYEAARHDQMMAKRRIDELEDLVRHAEIIDETAATGGVISLGSKVTVDFDGDEESYTIVGAIEAKPAQGLISNESPIGRALLGRKAGQTTSYSAPGGVAQIKIIRVE